jgi:hypothetical protein
MSTSVVLSKDARQLILQSIYFWFDNVRQEDTNEEDFLHMLRLQKRFEDLCPWINPRGGPPGQTGPNDGEDDEAAE